MNFKTKKEATEYFKNIKNSYERGEHLNASDQQDIEELLKYHENYNIKLGIGIDFIYVDEAPKPSFNTNCFYIRRIDGTIEDFSFYNCIKNSDIGKR